MHYQAVHTLADTFWYVKLRNYTSEVHIAQLCLLHPKSRAVADWNLWIHVFNRPEFISLLVFSVRRWSQRRAALIKQWSSPLKEPMNSAVKKHVSALLFTMYHLLAKTLRDRNDLSESWRHLLLPFHHGKMQDHRQRHDLSIWNKQTCLHAEIEVIPAPWMQSEHLTLVNQDIWDRANLPLYKL